jgi:hypothetical protein
MNRSFKPEFENLEVRMLMNAAAVLPAAGQPAAQPAARSGKEVVYYTITLTDSTVGQVQESAAPVSGRVTAVAADPASSNSPSRPGPGVYKSIDGGQTWATAAHDANAEPLPVLLVIADLD